MKHHIAVLDLGTNTFHLLIVEPQSDGSFKEVFRERRFVKIGLQGVGYMGKEAFDRALGTLIHYSEVLERFDIDVVWAIATEGLRKASNSEEFIDTVKEKTGIEIKCISGDTEALLIYYGVRQTVSMENDTALIMDIGGGSVEFIIANSKEIFWKQSFPIGSAVLRRNFHQTEPISGQEINSLTAHLEEILVPLFEVAGQFDLHTVVGASGAFDTLASIVSTHKGAELEVGYTSYEIAIAAFKDLKEEFLKFNQEERKLIKGMEPKRADMIVVSYLLIAFVVEKLDIKRLIQTNYAIKEGIIWSIMNEELSWLPTPS